LKIIESYVARQQQDRTDHTGQIKSNCSCALLGKLDVVVASIFILVAFEPPAESIAAVEIARTLDQINAGSSDLTKLKIDAPAGYTTTNGAAIDILVDRGAKW